MLADFPGAPYPGTWYQPALANKLAGYDLTPGGPDPGLQDHGAKAAEGPCAAHRRDRAIVDLGAVDTPVYGTLNPSQVAYQATDSGAKAAVVENPDQMAKFLEVKDRCPDLEHLIQIEGPTAPGVISMDEIVDSGATGDAGDLFWQRAEGVKGEDVLTLIYTSGTTGNPKGVVTHHRGAYLNAVSNILAWNATAHPVYLWTLPMFHCNGWCHTWMMAVLGGTVVCCRDVTAEAIYNAVAYEGVTHFGGAPIVLRGPCRPAAAGPRAGRVRRSATRCTDQPHVRFGSSDR